ncbi:MAG: FG-GAP-like repeat-containing protein, partial [bacterium]|nr:FG-GAP-like repeat-containing protein [bacterium]
LATPPKDYGTGPTRREVAERITRLFRDGIAAADSAENINLDFSAFDAFVVFHAGLGAEAGQQALNDIPSAFLDQTDLIEYAGGPISVDGGTTTITSGMLLPEAIGTDGKGGLNGTLTRFFASQLGLPGLSNFEDDLPAVGDWSLMDTGSNNLASTTRLGLTALSGDPGDTSLVGFIPSGMLAWSRMRLGWLTPQTITRNSTVSIVAPHVDASLPQAVKIPISATEYFLLENRISRLTVNGRVPNIEFSRPGKEGVWLSVDDYDAFIPGSGILIWHIDETVINAASPDHPVNSNPNYRIAQGQYRRGISLEEADGLEDIGNISADRVVQSGIILLDDIEGGPADPFYVGGTAVFGPETVPNSNSNLGYSTGIKVEVLSPPGDTMSVAITFAHQQDAWPVTGLPPNGLQAPRALDLNSNGRKEILRSTANDELQTPGEYPLTVQGEPFLSQPDPPFRFHTAFPPAVGNLITTGRGAEKDELIYADRNTLYMQMDNETFATAIDWALSPPPEISAPPVIAPFPDNQTTDIWAWTHGAVSWGSWKTDQGTSNGSVNLNAGPVTGLAVGNIDTDASSELIALTGTGAVFIVESANTFRQLATLPDTAQGAPVLADLDHNGQDEIVLLSKDGTISIFTANGLMAHSKPVPGGATSSPVLADLNNDGYVDILFGGQGRIWAVQFNGATVSDTPLDFPLKDATGPIEAPPVLADLDNDGLLELFIASRGGLLYGLNSSGHALPGFPLPISGPVRTSPLLDDLDNDGTTELVAFTDNGSVHLWHMETLVPGFTSTRIAWGQLGGNPGNTGRLLQTPQNAPSDSTTALLPKSRVYVYPNPIRNPSATLRFFLAEPAQINVIVLNALGEIVDRLALDNPVPNLENEIPWDTTDYASGLYICRIEAIGTNRSEVRFIKAAIIR